MASRNIVHTAQHLLFTLEGHSMQVLVFLLIFFIYIKFKANLGIRYNEAETSGIYSLCLFRYIS